MTGAYIEGSALHISSASARSWESVSNVTPSAPRSAAAATAPDIAQSSASNTSDIWSVLPARAATILPELSWATAPHPTKELPGTKASSTLNLAMSWLGGYHLLTDLTWFFVRKISGYSTVQHLLRLASSEAVVGS